MEQATLIVLDQMQTLHRPLVSLAARWFLEQSSCPGEGPALALEVSQSPLKGFAISASVHHHHSPTHIPNPCISGFLANLW